MKARYIGDYYKVMFEKGKVYDVLSIDDEGYYKIYSEAFEDWGLFLPEEFEIVEP